MDSISCANSIALFKRQGRQKIRLIDPFNPVRYIVSRLRHPTAENMTFLERLSAQIQRYLGRLFCLHGSIAVTNRLGNGTLYDRECGMEGESSSADQSPGFVFHWHADRSMKVTVQVAEAAPPEGYCKLIQVMRKQI